MIASPSSRVPFSSDMQRLEGFSINVDEDLKERCP